jgi:hypothetical protein
MRLATACVSLPSSKFQYPTRSPSTVDGVMEEERMRFLRRIIGLRRRKESDTVGLETG